MMMVTCDTILMVLLCSIMVSFHGHGKIQMIKFHQRHVQICISKAPSIGSFVGRTTWYRFDLTIGFIAVL